MAIEDTLRALIREELLALKQDLLVELRPTPAAGDQTPEYLTTEEAAELARVTPATIREWIKIGALRERRAGQKLLIKSSELHAHLAGDLAPDEDLVAARELARLGLR
jgi:excisionase family DNA binding protein